MDEQLELPFKEDLYSVRKLDRRYGNPEDWTWVNK